VQFSKRPSLLAFGAVGFSFLAVLLTESVWFSWFDISRALMPATSAVVIGMLGSRTRASPTIALGVSP
jgi:hypothetical protein